MSQEERKDIWGSGIPQYKKEDILEGEELIKFGMEILWQNEFANNNHKVIEATSKPGIVPNVVCEIGGKLSFIVVKVLSDALKNSGLDIDDNKISRIRVKKTDDSE